MIRIISALMFTPLLFACSASEERPQARPATTASQATDSPEADEESIDDTNLDEEEQEAQVKPEAHQNLTQTNPELGTLLGPIFFEGLPRNQGSIVDVDQVVQELSLFELGTQANQIILLHTATLWCSSCKTAAQDLAAEAEVLEAKGVTVIELVLEGATPGFEPTDSELALWAASNELSVATVRPSPLSESNLFVDREYAYLIDRNTREVLWREEALFTSPSITELAIDAVDEFLATP